MSGGGLPESGTIVRGDALDYGRFLEVKRQLGTDDGFAPRFIPDWLFDFQRALVEWAIRKGRAAIFADCGMGKTPMQLVWAQNVVEQMNRPVLILTPLAVGHQTVREAEKFGIVAQRSTNGKPARGITVANYEKLHLFDAEDFAGLVCDESSILKNFDGMRKGAITAFMRKLRYRLLCTATAAPNDYIELGTSSEALGYLGHVDMLNRFFKNDQNNSKQGQFYGKMVHWRLKPHAETPFWRWVCSWARALRKPSDFDFEDHGFVLPPLLVEETMVERARPPEDTLFPMLAVTLQEQRKERRATIEERCEMAAIKCAAHDRSIAWCHLNPEGDLLEHLLPGAVQVSGADSDEAKEEKLRAFADGQARVLVTKPTVAGFGLNFQHCAHLTFFPSHSFEQYYQAVRRCWRFGQERSVTVDLITTEGEAGVLANLQRKAAAADVMFAQLVEFMNEAMTIRRIEEDTLPVKIPAWL